MATIFTEIYNKNIPGEIVYDDKEVFAIMSIEPHNSGHVLVIPHEEIANWEDMSESLWAHTTRVAQDIAKVLKKLYGAPKIALSLVGFEIPHVHVHVFPIYKITDTDISSANKTTLDNLKPEADKIRSALKGKN